ncbi:MAG: chloride channel protein [Thermodesulfobacteriota bacterium]
MAVQLKFRFSDLFHGLTDRLHLNENTVTLIVASLIGIIGGYGAVAFRALIVWIQSIALGGGEQILNTVIALPWYRKIWIPTIGGLIVGPLVYFLGKETKGHGVPEVMEAVALRGAKIRVRVMFLKAFVSAVTIGTGGSVGREGPIVQIGSSMGSSLGQLLRVSKERMRILVACGAAAGIAATFNAPIAGVLFAIEIIIGNYAITTLVPLIMSSVMATIVGRWYFGDIPAFEIPRYTLYSPWEIPPYILLAVLTGFVAVAFTRILYATEDFVGKIKLKDWLKTPLVLFVIGLMLLYFPQVYGVGYDTISQVLKAETVWYLLLMLVPVKILATSITLAAGGSGGIFAPCLFLGAVFGGWFGIVMQFLFPATVVSPGAYAVVGMSAMVAGATHAPITAFMVIFEMTGDYKLILPLMLCAILASFVATLVMKDSIYTMKLTRRGVDLSRGMEVSIMQATKVRDVMKQEMVVLNAKAGFNEILESVISSNDSCYYVVDDDNIFQGSFNVHDIKEVLNEQSLAGLVVAKDLVTLSGGPFIEMDATVAQCMRKFSTYEAEELPVVENSNTLKLVGKISRQYLINFYNREILRQGSLGLKFIQGRLPTTAPTQSYIDLPDDFEIQVLPVTADMRGQTLKNLDVRNTFGVTVVSINRISERGERAVVIPRPDEALQKGDMLVLIGKREDLNRLKKFLNFNSDTHARYFHSLV